MCRYICVMSLHVLVGLVILCHVYDSGGLYRYMCVMSVIGLVFLGRFVPCMCICWSVQVNLYSCVMYLHMVVYASTFVHVYDMGGVCWYICVKSV